MTGVRFFRDSFGENCVACMSNPAEGFARQHSLLASFCRVRSILCMRAWRVGAVGSGSSTIAGSLRIEHLQCRQTGLGIGRGPSPVGSVPWKIRSVADPCTHFCGKSQAFSRVRIRRGRRYRRKNYVATLLSWQRTRHGECCGRTTRQGCRFLVAARVNREGQLLGLEDIATAKHFDGLFEAIPKEAFNMPISSSELRERANDGIIAAAD